jgi:hypothetical protein
MIDVILKEIEAGAISPGSMDIITYGGEILQESKLKKFIPFVSISVLNNSSSDIKVVMNETTDNAFRIPPNASRTLSGYPIWDVRIINNGATDILSGEVIVTLINDLENRARYNAYAKERGY